ncbi:MULTISPECIES: helix-turn-helix domain-containing protein [Christiangramia]|uniref:Transcriptional regulator, AraC family n=1 Tax=Christiangramia flava JLT2011 TaxID=1229726 RepID=A0A1L7I206_9FLAO|nr:helix-turn-helix domain-containing protein [Christiangramia flava]APU67636.1 Transcriptional regulator, AraC family [Christiangramia flava JLT2011]OSS37676.1 transcriptional regulator, AraC family [Christiangramia flava JLT2011]
MYNSYSQNRVQEILDFITEITLGKYTYTLPLRNQKNELEQIVVSLNTMVEEIDTVVHQINHDKSREVIQNLIFHLDSSFIIKAYSNNVEEVLGLTKKEMLHQSIEVLLGKETQLYEKIEEILQSRTTQNQSFPIELQHKNGYYWTGNAYIHYIQGNGNTSYILSVFKSVYQNEKLKKKSGSKDYGFKTYPSEYRSLLMQDQRKLARKIHKYITQRLDRKLQKLSVIATEVGASESKIKVIFKRVYGDTIYAYHLRKRLENAYSMIKDTSLPINEIAEECGFISFPHFSRSFKKEYGMTPTEARKSE